MNTVDDFKQGDKVIYIAPSGRAAQGEVTGLDHRYVLVKYGDAAYSKATEPADLRHAPKPEVGEVKKKCLGNGLYYFCDGNGIWLTAEKDCQQVYLDGAVLQKFLKAAGRDFGFEHRQKHACRKEANTT